MSNDKYVLFGDALTFVGPRSPKIVVERDIRLDLALVTATPPVTLTSNEKVRPLTMDETLQKIEEFKKMIEFEPQLKLVLNVADLKKAIQYNKTAVVLGLQNAPTGVDPQALFDAGIRAMSLAYYEENDLGSGFLNGGINLKKFGEEVIIKCAESGIIVDLSHVGHRTALGTLSFIKENRLDCEVMASHGGCVKEYHHVRNILNKVMRGIVDLGGVVGITTITFNLDEEKNDMGPFIKHIEHAVKVCGENSVVIGSDSVYINRTVEEAKKGIELLAPRLDELGIQGIRYPENVYEGPDLMKKIYRNLCDRKASSNDPYVGFVSGSFTDDQIKKIIGQNLFNFFERALPA